MAIELSTTQPLIQVIEVHVQLQVLKTVTECSLSLDCLLELTILSRFRLQILVLIYVEHQQLSLSVQQLLRVSL